MRVMKRLFFVILVNSLCSMSVAAGNADLFKGILLRPAESETLTLVAELARGTLSVIKTRGNHYDIIDQVPISIGKNGYGKSVEGDKRTPIGIYTIERYIADEDLPERYGVGAYTLDYPNFLDKKANKTGSGIWIHGMDRFKPRRPFLDSDGCVVIDNSQFERLAPILAQKPQVILAETLPAAIDDNVVDSLQASLHAWVDAWESLDVDRYLTFYSTEFDNGDKDYQAWVDHKKRVGAAKSFIDVSIDKISMLRYPSEDIVVQVDFAQRYSSNNYASKDLKRQYWRRTNAGWTIIYEASI